MALLAPDIQTHYPGVPMALDRSGLGQVGTMFLMAFPDFASTIEDQIAEGNKVVTRQRYTGTHQGDFNGIPPTGRTIEFTAITIDRIENDVIAERWVEYNVMGLMQQLGVIPSS